MTVKASKLAQMAEQIAANITVSTDHEVIATRLADHIQRFWDPRMRGELIQHAQAGDVTVSEPVRLALEKIVPLQPAN